MAQLLALWGVEDNNDLGDARILGRLDLRHLPRELLVPAEHMSQKLIHCGLTRAVVNGRAGRGFGWFGGRVLGRWLLGQGGEGSGDNPSSRKEQTRETVHAFLSERIRFQ